MQSTNNVNKYSLVQVRPQNTLFTQAYNHYVWIYAKNYSRICGSSRKRSKRHYVKIKLWRKCIYRTIETAGYTGINKDSIGLSFNSLCDLGIDPNNTSFILVDITPVRAIYYWFHQSDSMAKCSVWFSIATFIIGLIIGYITK